MIDHGAPCLRYARRGLVASSVLSLALSACAQAPTTSTRDFDRQVRVLQALTAIDGTQARPPSVVEQRAMSLRVTWEVEGSPELTWQRYRNAITKRLTSESELRPFETSDGSLLFVRTLPGDSDRPVREVAQMMVARGVHRLLVTEERRLLGLLTTIDLVRAIADGRLTE